MRHVQAEPLHPASAHLAEGPVWDADAGVLWWVDILAGHVHRLDPETAVDVRFDVGQPVGSLALRPGGGLVLALRDGFALADLDRGAIELVAPVEPDRPRHVMNDGCCDPEGRFWAGTMSLDLDPGAGALYRLDEQLGVDEMLTGVTASNGLDWSPDGRTLYYVDSFAGGVDCFDVAPATGTLSNRRCFAAVDGGPALVPDGLTVDADGAIWVAIWGTGSLRRFTPDGELDLVVTTPGAPLVTSCAFGGPNLDRLFITTARHDQPPEALREQPNAGSIFVARPGPTGRLPNRFGGGA